MWHPNLFNTVNISIKINILFDASNLMIKFKKRYMNLQLSHRLLL